MRGKFSTWVLIGLVVGGLSLMFPNNSTPDQSASESSPSPSDTATTDPFADPTDSPSVEPTDPANDASGGTGDTDNTGAAYWTKGFTAEGVTDSVNKNCAEFEMCVFVKLKTVNTCSAITLYGSIYDAEDNFIDTFDVDFATLTAGKSRVIEFGTDALADNEEYVELDDATCYK